MRQSRIPELLPEPCFQHSVTWPLDAPDARALFPDLTLPPSLAKAVLKRQLEFLAGRHCARAAIERCAPTLSVGTLAIGADRSPEWPPGIVGSITHTAGFAWAAVAPRGPILGLGIDSEGLVEPATARDIRRRVATDAEMDVLATAGFRDEKAVTLVFSAKESVFKCLHPLVHTFFGYLDAEVTSAAPGELVLRLLVDLGEPAPKHHEQAVRFELDLDAGRVHTSALKREP